jgi:hypothetical protein
MDRIFRKYFVRAMWSLIGGSAFTAVHGQEFSIKKVELAAENINIYYDLKDTVAGHLYTIYVYASLDNFVNPLTKIRGDLGLQVRPGFNRKITINAKEELGAAFEGKVGFQVQGKLFVPFITMKNFADLKSFKRTRKYTVTWSGGTTRNILNFDLYRGEKVRHTFAGIANLGHYDLVLPKNIRPGKNYYFRISDSKNKEEVIITEPFAVKRKIPLLLKAAGVVAAAFAIKLSIPEETEIIPGPPGPRKKD